MGHGVYTFLPQERVFHGPGCLADLPAEVERLGGRRVFIITGRTLAEKTPLVRQLQTLLGDSHVGTFSSIRQHVPGSDVGSAAEAAQTAGADLLLSFGGGSPIDGTKAVAYLLAEAAGQPPPHIAIPTTLSAAEYSGRAGYTDERTRTKARYADPRLVPRTVFLDPEVTLETPSWLWSSSGIRALDHAVETLYAPGSHPIQDVLALEAIRELFDCLPAAQQHPTDLDIRLRCQLASWMSFFAPESIHYGLSHTLSKAFGTSYNVPHGITSCITLPPVMRHMAQTHATPLARMARALGLARPETSDDEAAHAAADGVATLIQRLGLPSRLRDVGVPQDAFEKIARQAVGEEGDITAVVQLLVIAW